MKPVVADNPVAAALGRVPGARVAAVLCAVLLVLDLLAIHRAGDDGGVVRTARVTATRTGLRGADASPSLPELPAGVDPTLPPSDPLPAALLTPASSTGRAASNTSTDAPEGLPGSTPGAPAVDAGPLAFGTYTLAVTGTESLTGFGTRTLPSRATLTARPAGPDRARVELVLSRDHREHAVLAYGHDGISRAAEGSTVTFGAVRQTSEADLAPPVAEVPLPLQPTTLRGTTQVRGRDGTPSRTEDWTTQITGQDTLVMGEKPVALWVVKVERRTASGAAEQTRRTSTFWFDPARRTWVKWREETRIDKKSLGVPSTYEARYEAVLAGFKPT